MTRASIAKASLDFIAGCSLALLIAAGGGAAFAHGGGGGHSGGGHNDGDHVSNGGDHLGNGGHGRCIDCGGNWSGGGNDAGGGNIDGNYWRHHHHHIGGGPGGLGTVHGPGSSHNPIIAPVTMVRDHRTPPPHPGCNHYNIRGRVVRDHRTPPTPQCYGNLC